MLLHLFQAFLVSILAAIFPGLLCWIPTTLFLIIATSVIRRKRLVGRANWLRAWGVSLFATWLFSAWVLLSFVINP